MPQRAATKKGAPVTFPSKGTPPDQYGYPHYATMAEANVQFRRTYLRTLDERRRERAALRQGAGAKAAWAKRAASVRRDLAGALGLEISKAKPMPAPPRFIRAHPIFSKPVEPGTPAWAADLRAFWYAAPDAAWDGGVIECLILKPTKRPGPYPGVLLLPDAGAPLFGAQSPESAARQWGCALAAAGYLVCIPRLAELENFSSTQNKRRVLEGSCAIGTQVGEAARALDALLQMPGLRGRRVFVAGSGQGGLLALLLGALDGRVAGVMADAPQPIGTGLDPDALQVPRFNQITDLSEVAALLAPKPLLLAGALARDLQRGAVSAYRLSRTSGPDALKAAAPEQLDAWLQRHAAAVDARPAPGRAVRGAGPERKFALVHVPDQKTWQAQASRLRKLYRAQAGMPAVSKPLGVKLAGRVRLADCMREEYHVRTGPFTYSNLVFMRPHGPERRRVTILHLPGSGSDVAKVEYQYAHEIVAQGWNACIVDARVALYPFHPGIAEGMAMVNQSLHDLCCCLDYVAGREDVDPERIGTMGVSQGGTHSWMLAAMDDRIAAAAPVCGVCTYRSLWDEYRSAYYDGALLSFLDSHSIYYFTPGVLKLADQQDLCGLIAPRPFALIGGNHDDCFPLSGMRECDRDLRRLYRLFGKEENFLYYEFEGPHSMPEHSRRAAYAFFRKHFKA